MPTPVQKHTGRWTAEEHRLFLQGLEQHGKGWKKIASLIKSRTVVQIRTHAQKYFQKLAKARQNGEQVGGVMDGSGAEGGNGNHGQVTMATRDDVDASTSSYPQVTMQTISHHAGNGGNMSIGSDPTRGRVATVELLRRNSYATPGPFMSAGGPPKKYPGTKHEMPPADLDFALVPGCQKLRSKKEELVWFYVGEPILRISNIPPWYQNRPPKA